MLELFLDPQENRLIGPGGNTVRFAHHLAGHFLALLIARRELGKGVDHRDLVLLWRSKQPVSRGPDRTASSRLLQAVLNGLHEATGLEAANTWVEFPPRGRTTGPWRLRRDPGIRWQVGGPQADAIDLAGDWPRLGTSREGTLQAIETLMIADERFRSGSFEAVAEALRNLAEMGTAVSEEGKALVALRRARALRRLGDRAQANALLEAAIAWASEHRGLAARSIRAEAEVLRARLDYDANPTDGRHISAARKLLPVAASAPDPRSLWECLNTCALGARGRMMRTDDRAEQRKLNSLADQCYESALFWLTLLQDHYYQRAVCANRAHHLTTSSSMGLEPGWPQALEWYRLSHAIEDRFNMIIDTALDSIFLAELWLGASENARVIRSQAVFWIDGKHPGDAAFWTRAMDLARQEHDGALEEEMQSLMRQCLQQGKPERRTGSPPSRG